MHLQKTHWTEYCSWKCWKLLHGLKLRIFIALIYQWIIGKILIIVLCMLNRYFQCVFFMYSYTWFRGSSALWNSSNSNRLRFLHIMFKIVLVSLELIELMQHIRTVGIKLWERFLKSKSPFTFKLKYLSTVAALENRWNHYLQANDRQLLIC